MSRLSITSDGAKRIYKRLNALNVPRQDINDVVLKTAQEMRDAMINRITRGISSDGKKFEQYSKPYAKIRAKAGRNLKSDRLIFTDNMLANYQAQMIRPDTAAIAFTSNEEAKKAEGNQARYNQFPMTKNEHPTHIARALLRGNVHEMPVKEPLSTNWAKKRPWLLCRCNGPRPRVRLPVR